MIGELNDTDRRKLRGPVFHANSKVDALKLHRDLLKLAIQAANEGTIAEFLDSLDSRARPDSGRGPLFRAFVQEWLDVCVKKSDLRESQVESDVGIVEKHLFPAFGNLPLVEIDARRIDRFIASKRRQKHQYGVGYAPATINNFIGVLSRIFEKALDCGHIEKNPITRKTWLAPDRTAEDSREWLRPEEEQRVWEALGEMKEEELRMYFAIGTQLLTGIRFAELRALKKEDLDLTVPCLLIRTSQARRVTSTPKNKKARAQVIPRTSRGSFTPGCSPLKDSSSFQQNQAAPCRTTP